MWGAGVRGIWDFAPVHLDVPDYVAIKYEDLATSFLVLSNQLSKKIIRRTRRKQK